MEEEPARQIDITEYLSSKIDTRKLNVTSFQRKIQKFQTQYGLKLTEPSKKINKTPDVRLLTNLSTVAAANEIRKESLDTSITIDQQ